MIKIKDITKLLVCASVVSMGLGNHALDASASESSYLNKIVKMEPFTKKEELMSQVKELAKKEKKSNESILKSMYLELKKDEIKAQQENKKMKGMGGNSGGIKLGSSKKGNFYYTAAKTAYMNHGHVGLFMTNDKIVESVPKKGVRIISASKRKVDEGKAVIKSISTSKKKRDAAIKWAVSRVNKDDYSYNFASNRHSSHTGDKNCSKLIWSAYKLKAKIDLDVDGGMGIYPRDVRDAKNTKVVKKL